MWSIKGDRYADSNYEIALTTVSNRAFLILQFEFLSTQNDRVIYFDDLQWHITVVKCQHFALYCGLTNFDLQSDAMFVWDLRRFLSRSLRLCPWLKVGSVWNDELLPFMSNWSPIGQPCPLAGKWCSQTLFSHRVCLVCLSIQLCHWHPFWIH